MKRPDNPILVKLDETISQLHDAEKLLAESKTSLSEQARAISSVGYADFEPLLRELHSHGFYPENDKVSAVAFALRPWWRNAAPST